MSVPSERVERVIRCPHGDGRAVARIVVRDGARYLNVVGGRHARGAGQRLDHAVHLIRAGNDLDLPDDDPRFALHRALAQAISGVGVDELDETVHPESHLVPSRLDVLARDAGVEPFSHPAACPRCHALLWLVIEPKGDDGWNVVLSS